MNTATQMFPAQEERRQTENRTLRDLIFLGDSMIRMARASSIDSLRKSVTSWHAIVRLIQIESGPARALTETSLLSLGDEIAELLEREKTITACGAASAWRAKRGGCGRNF